MAKKQEKQTKIIMKQSKKQQNHIALPIKQVPSQQPVQLKQYQSVKMLQQTQNVKQYFSRRMNAQQPKSQEQQLKEQAEQSYIKYKQIQQITNITQKVTTYKTTIVIVNEDQPSNNPSQDKIFRQTIQLPKQTTVDEQIFFKKPQQPSQIAKMDQSDKQQRQNVLTNVKKVNNNEFSMNSLKDHIKFIAFISELSHISTEEYLQVNSSIKFIEETVSSHNYYVRKVNDSETILKLIKIYKNLFLNKQSYEQLILNILKLCLSMSTKKQKNLILFSDDETIQFFKLIIKNNLNVKQPQKTDQIVILLMILLNCKNNTEHYYQLGLLSMIIQLVNRKIAVEFVLQYFIKLELSTFIINQIYQRGLFNKLINIFNQDIINDHQKKILNLWIKLAGKVCINSSIQNKFKEKMLHVKVWQKFGILNSGVERLNIAYFYAYMCLKNDSICQWMMQKRVLEQILQSIKNETINQQLYLLFYHFCFNIANTHNRDYCYRIKYHLHLIDRINAKWQQIKNSKNQILALSKYFYKSLGQILTNKMYHMAFFKEEAIRKLMDIFDYKIQPSIFQCFLDFISVLESDLEFQELKKQRFWNSLKIFDYKISNQATYSYLLQIFLIMIKKGRIKQFNQEEIRRKVCLKAQFSINMQGKQLALRFMTALSIKMKQNYLNQRTIRLLSSIMGLKIGLNELKLAYQMLTLQKGLKYLQFLIFYHENDIDKIILDNIQKFNNQQLELALKILAIIAQNQQNNIKIGQKCLFVVSKYLTDHKGAIFKQTLKLLTILSSIGNNNKYFELINCKQMIQSKQVMLQVKNSQSQKQFTELLDNFIKNNTFKIDKEMLKIIENSQLVDIGIDSRQSARMVDNDKKQKQMIRAVSSLQEGRKVKMYKLDGSISELLLFVSSDSLELNCALKLSQVVKQKWRLPVNEITKVIQYSNQQSNQFKNSYFEKNSGFFNKAPECSFCLSIKVFNSASEKQQWLNNFKLAKQYSKGLLQKMMTK